MKIFQYENFNEKAKKIDDKFLYIKEKIKLDSLWSEKDCFKIEIKKSYIKGFLRYEKNTRELLEELVKSYNKINNKKFKYTNFYPMIHLSKDKTEFGGFHFDQVDNNNLHTLWIAISPYQYPALSVFNYSSTSNFINKFLIKTKLTKLFSKKIYPQQGDLNIWDGQLIHAGNFNNSPRAVMAFQMKILNSEESFIFEDTENYPQKFKSDNYNQNFDENYLIKDYDFFSQLVNLIEIKSREDKKIFNSFDDIAEIFKNNINFKKKEFSFSLSILSQRIRSFQKLFQNQFQNIGKFVTLLDYASTLIGAENLISFKRLFLNNEIKNQILENIMKNDVYDVCHLKKDKINLIIKTF